MMKISLLLLPVLAFSGAVARADLSYTQKTSSPFGAAGNVTSKTYAKGDSARTEMQIFGRRMISISQGAKKVIQIDPATKTYTVSNIGSAAIAKSMIPGGNGKMPSMNMTVSTKNLGFQTVRGVKAPRYRVDMNMKMGTPRGPQTMKMGIEVWGSNVALPISAKMRADALAGVPDNLKAMFGNSSKIKGDLKGMSAAFKTVPLRMKMQMNGQTISTTETSAISTRALPASLFTVPSGYRAVSNAQFAQTQQAAMRKGIAGMMKR